MSEIPHMQPLLTLILVQDGEALIGPSPPGQEDVATEAADGSLQSGAQQKQPSLFSENFVMMVMLVIFGMIVFSFFGGRKQKKKRSLMLDSLKKHDQVLTRGGVFGSIVEVKSDRVVLKVDESSNTRITVLRDSIEQVTADSSGN